jgi:hypothetical protein
MKTKLHSFVIVLALFAGVYSVAAQGTDFTYQGQLNNAGGPANGIYDMTYKLWTASSGGAQVGITFTVTGVPVTNGLFTATIGFGNVFNGSDYWLELGVRTNGVGSYQTLLPRQELTPTPYAITAENIDGAVPASQLSGTIPSSVLSGTYGGGLILNNAANSFDGNGAGLTTLNASQLTTGTVPDARLSANVALLNANQTFTGSNIFNSGLGTGRFIINSVDTDQVDTSLFTGLSLQYAQFSGEGAIMSAYNDGFGYLSFYTKQGSGYPIVKQMQIDQYGGVAIDLQNYNNGVLNDGTTNGVGLTFGTTSGEGIASKRTAGVNQYGLDFYTSFIRRMSLSNGGNLIFPDPTTSIQFAATAGANNPMMFMFDSGTGNADRMVIAHSPSFPTWGLQYSDATDKFRFLSASNDVMTVDLGSQRVGVGTATPSKAKVEIEGVSGAYAYGQRGILNSAGALSGSNTGTDNNASLWASGNVWASAFLAFSDERIKHIEGRSDSARDLAALLGIEITDYTYIDTVAKGTAKQKKVIAQQVEKVYPQAVVRNTDVVPDIYQDAELKNGWVQLATNLKKGEHVRLISGKNEGIYEVLEVAPGKFRTDFSADGETVFVYGREVKDFRSVDYIAIAMLNVSATQELYNRLEKQAADLAKRDDRIALLEKSNQEMQRELNAQKELASRMQAEFANVQKVVAHLAKKSDSSLAFNH